MPIDPALDPADTSGRFPPSGKPGDSAWANMSDGDWLIVDTVIASCGKAIEAYERLLVSQNAPFDRYVAGDPDALNESAKRGLKLFIGKAACSTCHDGQTFTDQQFHNTGVPQAAPDRGRIDDVLRLPSPFNGAGLFSDDPVAGAAKLAGVVPSDALLGEFRTKSLRHLTETAPYFHDGSAETLEDVVRFYNSGGGAPGTYPGVKDPMLVPLNLSEREIADLVEFLRALTGEPVPAALTANTAALAPLSH
jgi:cytochrome c peroxidase